MRVVGQGEVHVQLFRRPQAPADPDPVADPWHPTPAAPGPEGWSDLVGPWPAPQGALDPVRDLSVVADEAGTTVDLGVLEVGDWRVEAVSDDGVASSALELSVRAGGVRLVGGHDAGLGQTLHLGVQGAAALITVASDRLLWATVRTPGGRSTAEVRSDWGERVAISALGSDGSHHQRQIEVDPRLQVDLQTRIRSDGNLSVHATVTDGAGRPVAAQVSLAGWDLRLEAGVGPPRGIDPDALVPWVPESIPVVGLSAPWRDGDTGHPIVGALRDEADRIAERRKAERARSGLLSDNGLARMWEEQLPIPDPLALGGLGTHGVGSGHGGMAGGVAGGVVGGGLGSAVSDRIPGVRHRVLWTVVQTGSDGVATGVLTGPPARYRIRATAVATTASGTADVTARTDERVWMVAHEPAPGAPGDRGVPYVTVVNGTSEAWADTLRGPDGSQRIALPPGAAITVAAGAPHPAGPDPVVLAVASATAVWRFPLAPGAPGTATVAVGPQGNLPVEALALAHDPALDVEPWRHADRGRAALAALAVVDSPALRRAVRNARDVLRIERRRPTPAAAASAVLFLAELKASGLLPVAPAEITDEAEHLQQVATIEAGVWAALARAGAGLPIDPDLMAFLRAADLDPADAGRLALALARLGHDDEAIERATGDLWGALALDAAGQHPDPRPWLALGPPPVADPLMAEWIRWMGRIRRSRRRGLVRVWVGEQEVGSLPLGTGGQLTVAADPATVQVDGGLGVIWGSDPVPDGGVPLAGLRVPQRPDGTPMPSAPPPVGSGFAEHSCNPCSIAVGEGLRLPMAVAPGWVPPGLSFDPASDRALMWAVAPGTVTLRGIALPGGGLAAPLRIDVVEAEAGSALHPDHALARSEARVAAGDDPQLPALDGLPDRIGWATRLALDHALGQGDDAAIVEHFQRLVAVDPAAALQLEDVARVARAMMATGRHDDATRVWRAGLDAAFVAEAGRLSGIEDHVGILAAAKLVRDAALRYPDGPGVGEALYLLPSRLRGLANAPLDPQVQQAGITAMDLRLTAAAWDREFLALYPDHPRASAVGLRLGRSLLTLGAPDRAATWARTVAAAHPDDPLLDALTYLQALALTEAGGAGAETLLRRLVHEPFPDRRGALGPSTHRDDARLVLGRLFEARGDHASALAAYAAIAEVVPEAARSEAALRRKGLTVPPRVRIGSGQGARFEVVAQGIEAVSVRAYAVDLRTIFLRDGGLGGVGEMSVAGVSPTWSGSRRLGVGPFPEARSVSLPLAGTGAWLVHIEGDGVRTSTLVVRSAMALGVVDQAGVRRLTVRRRGLPQAGVEVRALTPQGVVAVATDVRGVVEVPEGSAVLAFDGGDVAFTDPEATGPMPTRAAPPSPSPTLPLGTLDQRLGEARTEDQDAYRRRFSRGTEEMSLQML